MLYQLCKVFPALNPYELERQTFHEVVRLYADVRRVQIREQEENDPDRVIYVPAGDNWF